MPTESSCRLATHCAVGALFLALGACGGGGGAGHAPSADTPNAAAASAGPVAAAATEAGRTEATPRLTALQIEKKPLKAQSPIRRWTLIERDLPPETGPVNDKGELMDFGGELHEVRTFGQSGFGSAFDGDGIRTLEAFSSESGRTFWVSAEDVGLARLRQSQKFLKQTDGATLQIVISAGLMEAMDANHGLLSFECPQGPALPHCQPMHAYIKFEAEARTMLGEFVSDASGKPALDSVGFAAFGGYEGHWTDLYVAENTLRTRAAWKRQNFSYTKNASGGTFDAHPRAQLVQPVVINVDLSQVPTNGEFRIITTLDAYAGNKRGRESALGAFLRDPVRTGGAEMLTTGLLALPDTGSTAPPVPRPAAPCNRPVPDPAAGVLQFSAPTYTLAEEPFSGHAAHGVHVTRTQGSTGAVSASVSTGGGTALGGVHFAPLTATVHFDDGDTTPRLIPLDVLENSLVGPVTTTVELALSSPGGCAAIGPQGSAVVTLLDDDGLPPPPPPSGLDNTFGNAGKATLPGFGGDRSGMALQADGKIVMVGGTASDFILARFNADGSLDRGFGIDGKVTTDMGAGAFRQEEALAVAVQPDGKIVVAGYTAIPSTPPAPRLPDTFALARYTADGTLDTTFGVGGRVSGNVGGIGRAVAIQPDGKIVVAGDVAFPSSNGLNATDFTVARFLPNGLLDMLGFGLSGTGQVAIDLGSDHNTARNLVLQPDGAIVLSGHPTVSAATHTDVLRLRANGTPDPLFGSNGHVRLNNLQVGEGLARQPDGKLVLVGSVVQPVFPATSDFVLLRLNADGSPDVGFGNAGRASTPLAVNATAGAVALQADGRIVVAGTRAFSANPNFVVARYGTTGGLDTGFGVAGTLSVDFSGDSDIAENVLVQPDGRIVVGGQARANLDGYGVARILP